VQTQNVLFLNKVFVGQIVIKQIKVVVNFKIRGIEKMLYKRGIISLLLNFVSNFGDITGADFVFPELELAGINENQEAITE